MYYATYKGIGNSDIAEFKTAEERDNWVNFKDEASIVCGTTPDNCTFQREVFDDEKVIDEITHDPSIIHNIDIFNESQVWYLRSVQ